MTSERH